SLLRRSITRRWWVEGMNRRGTSGTIPREGTMQTWSPRFTIRLAHHYPTVSATTEELHAWPPAACRTARLECRPGRRDFGSAISRSPGRRDARAGLSVRHHPLRSRLPQRRAPRGADTGDIHLGAGRHAGAAHEPELAGTLRAARICQERL